MKESLMNIGLTKSETAIYIALLRLGPSTNSPIVKNTKLQSSTVYYCLNPLIEKGFVNYTIKNNRKHFNALNPENIPSIINEKIRYYQQQQKEINNIIPKLKKIQGTSRQKTTAEVYEGFEGFKTIFYEIIRELKKGESYQAFVIEQVIDEPQKLRLLFIQHNKTLKAKKINLRLLANKKMRDTFKKLYGKSFLRKYQEIRYTNQRIPVGITIYKDKVVTHISEQGDLMSFKITNTKLADDYRAYFNEIWKTAER